MQSLAKKSSNRAKAMTLTLGKGKQKDRIVYCHDSGTPRKQNLRNEVGQLLSSMDSKILFERKGAIGQKR